MTTSTNATRPVRDQPFLPSCHMGGDEKARLLECLESLQWSSFRAGVGAWDVRELLALTSADAAGYDQHELKFLGGRRVRQLEARFAETTGTTYAVSANAATSALHMALASLNLGLGDEVLVPCMSFHASATAVVQTHATPVFVEIKPDTLCMDPADMVSRITARTKAVMVVHLSGNTADMDAIMAIARKHNLKVVEDCAQSPGVTYKGRHVGAMGDAGVFSLTETKNITSGEGGMLITNDPRVAFKARLIRNHGEVVTEQDWPDEDLINIVGLNYRLTELQAALALSQYAQLEDRNQIRRDNAAHLYARLAHIPELIPQQAEAGADYTCFIAKWRYLAGPGMPTRDELVKAMANQGIPLVGSFPKLLHEIPLYTRGIAYAGDLPNLAQPEGRQRYGVGACPVSEEVNRQLIWFGFVNPPQTKADMDDVARAFSVVLERSPT